MTTHILPYGHSQLDLTIPHPFSVDLIIPPEIPAGPDPASVISDALGHPVDEVRISNFRGARTVAIAINDKTRPVAHEIILPPLLAELESIGILPENILIVIATGTHVPMPAEEFNKVIPIEILARYPVISHDCDDNTNLVDLGKTTRGTPIFVNRRYYEADLKIVVGNIEPHHFMGFSGGVKSASIGVGGRVTINQNHSMLLNPDCVVGTYETNPMRMDVEEIGKQIGIHFALNIIPNREKQIIRAFAGSPSAVMKAGIPISQQVCQVRVKKKYDLVIASVGGYPKDINIYQSQKALTHASIITRNGGIVILAAECIEGSGSAGFEAYMQGITSYEQVLTKFKQEGFRVGPHKAFQIAREAARIHIYLQSSLTDEMTRWFFMTPTHDLQASFLEAINRLGPDPSIAVLPRATNTVPVFSA